MEVFQRLWPICDDDLAVLVMPAIATNVTVAWSLRPSVCMSTTLVHPTKAAGRNKTPFDDDRPTYVAPGNTVLYCPRTEKEVLGSGSRTAWVVSIVPCVCGGAPTA